MRARPVRLPPVELAAYPWEPEEWPTPHTLPRVFAPRAPRAPQAPQVKRPAPPKPKTRGGGVWFVLPITLALNSALSVLTLTLSVAVLAAAYLG